MTDANDDVAALLYDSLRSAAVLDALLLRIQQLRERVATGRTYVASERAADQAHAVGGAA